MVKKTGAIMTDINRNSNQGIIITGGAIKADQVAVGTGAVAQKTIDTSQHADAAATIDDLRKQLSSLLDLIKQHRDILDASTEGAVEVAMQEAEREKPNKVVMSSIMDGITNGVKSISSVASAVNAIKSLIDIAIR